MPALWRLALKFGHPPSRGSLARVHVGSAPLSSALWTEIAHWSQAEVVNYYGMTETANWDRRRLLDDGIADGLVGAPGADLRRSWTKRASAT